MTPKRARKAKAARKPTRKAAPKAAALIEVMVQSPRWKTQPRAAAIVRNAVAAAASPTAASAGVVHGAWSSTPIDIVTD